MNFKNRQHYNKHACVFQTNLINALEMLFTFISTYQRTCTSENYILFLIFNLNTTTGIAIKRFTFLLLFKAIFQIAFVQCYYFHPFFTGNTFPTVN